MTSIIVSVVVATFNRSEGLKTTVQSLLDQSLPKDLYEIIVVDNASTDDTAETVKALIGAESNLRYVFEAQPGVSHARNTGWATAAGEWVAFIDDDAWADSKWLEGLVSATGSAPEVVGIGGKIALEWVAGRPSWLPHDLEGYYGFVDKGDARREIKFASGSNMCIRRDSLKKAGGFAGELGPVHDKFLCHEEPELFERLRRDGGTVIYEPSARVVHVIGSRKATRRWLAGRALIHGRSGAIQQGLSASDPADPKGWVARARWAIKESLKPRLTVEGMSRPEVRLYRVFLVGFAIECLKLARAAFRGRWT